MMNCNNIKNNLFHSRRPSEEEEYEIIDTRLRKLKIWKKGINLQYSSPESKKQ